MKPRERQSGDLAAMSNTKDIPNSTPGGIVSKSNAAQKVQSGLNIDANTKSRHVETNLKQTGAMSSSTAPGLVPSSSRNKNNNPGLTVDTKLHSFSDATSESRNSSAVPTGTKIVRQSSKRPVSPASSQQQAPSGGCLPFICCGSPPKEVKKRTTTPHPRLGNNNNSLPQTTASKSSTFNAPIDKSNPSDDVKSVTVLKEAIPISGKNVNSASSNSSNKPQKIQVNVQSSSATTTPLSGPAGMGSSPSVTVGGGPTLSLAPTALVAPVALKSSTEPGASIIAAKIAAVPVQSMVDNRSSSKESVIFSTISAGKSSSAFTEKESSPKLIPDDRTVLIRAAVEGGDTSEIDTSASNVHVVIGSDVLKKNGRSSGASEVPSLVRYW